MPETVKTTEQEADRLKKYYVCKTCWGPLDYERNKLTHECSVHCRNKTCEGKGFVSGKWAEQQEDQAHWDAFDARQNLKGIIPSASDGKTAEDVLADLYGS